MNSKTIHKLEFDKILSDLKKETHSSMAKEMIDNTKFSSNPEQVKNMQNETSEASFLIKEKGGFTLGGLNDIRKPIKLAEKDGILSVEQLINILKVLKVNGNIKNTFNAEELRESYPLIAGIVDKIPREGNLRKRLEEVLDLDELDFRDNASSELLSLRRQIRSKRSELKTRVEKVKKSHARYLQEELVTLRNDRYVLPVKAEHQGMVKGVTHDYSTSGATVYIEPQSVMELSNDISRLVAKKAQEVEKLLRMYSQDIKASKENLNEILQFLVEIDFILAKGALSIKMEGCEPEINSERYLKIKQGRHPLLGEEAVPLDIELGDNFNILVITGPNTGGKTVTLKTAGLFTLMTQFGLHIPAASGSEMAVFNGVYADIGDEQNIEQNLSTFSSHMKNIINILENANSDSLVLLDELGAGTDPTEGSALAMAILKYLYNNDIRTIATTHFTSLKNFAYNHEGMENASVEFDEETLQPTFKLLIGIPGKSNALYISKKLGLKEEIIDQARELIGKEDLKVDELISSLTEKERKSEKIQEDMKRSQMQVDNLKARLEKKEQELKEKEKEILEKARREAAEIVTETKRQAERTISEVRKLSSKDSAEDINKTSAKVKKELQEKRDKIEEELVSSVDVDPLTPEELKPGMEVYVKSLEKSGVFQALSADKKEAQVQVGLMKVSVDVEELLPCEGFDDAAVGNNYHKEIDDQNTRSSTVGVKKAGSISQELDIRGQTIDEAIETIEKYLDDAILAGYNQVRIIHGKGTGNLRKGVHFHLQGHDQIKNYRLGEKGEGGEGVTVVNISG